jgi:hypothetical protein
VVVLPGRYEPSGHDLDTQDLGQVGQRSSGSASDDKGQNGWFSVNAVDDEGRAVAKVVDVDGAEVLHE